MNKRSVHVPKNLPVSHTVNSAISFFLREAEKEYVRCFDLFSNTHYRNNPEKRILTAKRYTVLKSCVELTDLKRHSIKEVFEAYKELESSSIISYEYFTRKLKELRCDGAASFIHGRINHKYVSKINPHVEELIHAYLSLPNKYSYNEVKGWVNRGIKDWNDYKGTNFSTISKTTVARYYMNNRNEINYHRDKKSFDTDTRPYLNRITALNAGSLMQMDGTPVQIFCWNHPSKWEKDGKRQIRLNLFVIRDAFSGKITGFDMSEHEDRYNIIASIKMMVSRHNHLPAEIVHDNFSASKTDEFKAIKSQLEDKGVKVRAAKVGNAQDKGEVERYFGTFQTRFQRLIDGYLGEGILSKRPNGRIAESWINKCKKENGLYGYDEMRRIIAELIEIYNNSTINEKYNEKTPNILYAESEKTNVKPVNALDFVLMFWLKKEVIVRKSMIINEVRKSKRFYEIWNNDKKLLSNGQKVRIYYEEDDASEIHVCTLDNEFICNCKQQVQIHEAYVDQLEGEGERIMKHVAHRDAFDGFIDKKADDRVEKAKQFRGEAYEIMSPLKIEKLKLNNIESQVLLKQYYNDNDINTDKMPERVPVLPSTPYFNRELTDKPKKKGKKDVRTATATYDTV